MLGAAFSPRLMLALGLIATSGINVAFGFTTGVWWWTLLWAMNGGIQVSSNHIFDTSARTTHASMTAAAQNLAKSSEAHGLAESGQLSGTAAAFQPQRQCQLQLYGKLGNPV
jgi:hypothetical protein